MMNRNCIKGGKIAYFIKLLLGFMSLWILTGCSHLVVLNPKGIIASDERDMIFIATCLMLIVVIPVFIMTFFFAYKYRATNIKAKYTPEWGHSTVLEVICWSVSCLIIVVLATLTWITTHRLDPYKPLDSQIKPVTIQVVALDWKWLFIYPEEKIATVNYIQFPDHVPINFKITADAPMNSFWIPQLGGQIYAMTGMQTKLHLYATNLGDYNGASASFSGSGFSGMKFIVKVSSMNNYENWVKEVRASTNDLTAKEYEELARPSEDNPVKYYGTVKANLYDDIMMKFMMPMGDMNEHEHMLSASE